MIKKSFTLVSLSLGIVFINSMWSAMAQVVVPTQVTNNTTYTPPTRQPLPPSIESSLRRLQSIPIPVPLPSRNLPNTAQVVIPVTVPTNPHVPPPAPPSTPPARPVTPPPRTTPPASTTVPLRRMNLGDNCTPRHACLGWDEQLWDRNGQRGDRQALLTAIDHSLSYLQRPSAIAAYQNFPVRGITHDRVRRSLIRFRQLVVNSRSPEELQAAVRREFVFYRSVGNDGNGTVKFTAYYEPIYQASRVRTAEYRYPIFRRPPDFDQWPKPHPTRIELEGADALLGERSRLSGLEMFWFRDRFLAYMVQIQGSAQLELTDGTRTSVGFAGGTDFPWTSIGGQLHKDGKLAANQLNMPGIINFFQRHPYQMNNFLPRWERFVFFQENPGRPATGSINVPVTAERSIATDKSLMPPGALALVHTSLPFVGSNDQLEYRTVSRFVLDQDTGSAIRGAGRVDYFMGSGPVAGRRAGVTGGNGSLYYLLLRQ